MLVTAFMSKISLNSDSPNWLTWVAFWELSPEQRLNSKEHHTYSVHHAIHSRIKFVTEVYKGQYEKGVSMAILSLGSYFV